MLVAKRDSFELGAHDRLVPPAEQGPVTPRFTRALHIVQLLGALVAVPAGLGSAYTMYKTNYSPEAACQTLRASIVAMLDRNVDAGMRRALVRRDVETFERTCSAADPDATVAFNTLLALDRAPPAAKAAPAAQQTQASVRKTAPAAKAEPAPPAKAEPAPLAKAEQAPVAKAEPAKPKQPAARATAAASAPAAQPAPEPPMSDAAWLAAVRSALDTRQGRSDRTAATAPAAPRSVDEVPQALPSQGLPTQGLSTQGLPTQASPSAPATAPALPPPVAAMPAPRVEPDHPVPPGAIPDPAPPEPAKRTSSMEGLVSEIPIIGKTLADQIR